MKDSDLRGWAVLGVFLFLLICLISSGNHRQAIDFSIPNHDARITALEQKVFGK